MSEKQKKQVIEFHTGRKASEETKEKMRESILKRRKKNGYINSPEARIKIGKSRSGERSHFWKGGVSKLNDRIRHLPKMKGWKISIFKRDNYICQMPNCNKKEDYINAHHIKEFSIILEENNIKSLEEAEKCKELWDTNNGITLCKKCHDKIRQHEQEYAQSFLDIIKFK